MKNTPPKRPKAPIPIGTDVALHITAKDGHDVVLSYWDVWYVLLAEDEFEGGLDQLGLELRGSCKGSDVSDDVKRKRNHLRDLQQRLTTDGISVQEILDALPTELTNAETRRAYGRIFKHNERAYEHSEPMRWLPEGQLYGIALRGMWGDFPVSPAPYYKKLRNQFNWRRYHEEDASWDLAKKLDAETKIARTLAKQGKLAEAFAVLRSVMSVAIELTSVVDDSFGCIGMSFENAFEDYLGFPRNKTGIAPATFFADLLELLIFEDVYFTNSAIVGFFTGLSREESDFCLTYLRDRIPALMALDLDSQAESTLTLLGQVAAEQKQFELFEVLAAKMGSRAWERITRMADAAETSGKHDLADRVFLIALACEDGGLRDDLSKMHAQLLNGKWSPDPRK